MTRQEALERLKALKSPPDDDIEAAHLEADLLLCSLLENEGYGDVVLAWKQVPKWYG